MNTDISSNKPARQSQLDDSYWIALFEQEDAIAPDSATEAEGEVWPKLNQQLNDRFNWSDNNKVDPWQVAKDAFESDQILELTITGYNKGGLLVEWHGLQGFIPASQLLNFPRFHVERERLNALKQWLDKSLQLKIIEVNPEKKRLILSERIALVKAEQRNNLMHRISSGDILQGHITNLTKFGAFVDLGGVEGLIHISELSWSRVIHPSDIIRPGQAVTVQVLHIDRRDERVALSLKRLKPNPWQKVEERYQPGQIVEGVVSNVVSFGAFVLLEEELEGLIHLSELAEGVFLHARNVVQKGERVRVKILHVDGSNKRLALSLRDVT